MLREDLWQALLQAVRTSQLGALAGAGQVALSLWLHLGSQLLLQLEAFLQIILQRLAQGSRLSASQHQEAALEVRAPPQHTHWFAPPESIGARFKTNSGQIALTWGP